MSDTSQSLSRRSGSPWRRFADWSNGWDIKVWSNVVPHLRILYRRYDEAKWALRSRRKRRSSPVVGNMLPYDSSNSVVYVKDWPRNCYTDDYVMALASAGQIKLEGFITSSSIAPHNPWVTGSDYEQFVDERVKSVQIARASGLRNIPDPVRGPKGHLVKPTSGHIDDTIPMRTDGSRLIVERARRATPDKPLVIAVCCGLTVVADAYLMDPSIEDRVIVAWLGGRKNDMADYDGWSDGWAAYIALNRLRLIQFIPFRSDPHVPKSRLLELPETPLREWMIDRQLPKDQGSPRDADAPPLVSIVRDDYVLETARVSFGGWIYKEGHEVPALKRDPLGSALLVTLADKRVATEAWWATMKNPAVYTNDKSDD